MQNPKDVYDLSAKCEGAADYYRITSFLLKLLPEKWRNRTLQVKDYVVGVALMYIKSYALIMGITFLELCVGFLFLKISYAVILAIIIALFDILPILGTGGILIPWAVILSLLLTLYKNGVIHFSKVEKPKCSRIHHDRE